MSNEIYKQKIEDEIKRLDAIEVHRRRLADDALRLQFAIAALPQSMAIHHARYGRDYTHEDVASWAWDTARAMLDEYEERK